MSENYEVISSCINSVIMVILFFERTRMKCLSTNSGSIWNYWHAESTLAVELNAHIPQLLEVENAFRSFESKLQSLQLDEKELSLLLLMIITRTSKIKRFFFNQINSHTNLLSIRFNYNT